MTEPRAGDGDSFDRHLTDDDISALVDGEQPVVDGIDDVDAHVESCAVCRRRLAQFRQVAAAVAVPPAGDPEHRELAIQLALGGKDALSERRSSTKAMPAWIGGIAAAVVAISLLASIDSGQTDNDDSVATGAGESSEQQLEHDVEDSAPEGGDTDGNVAPSASRAVGEIDFGSVPAAGLADAVRTALAEERATLNDSDDDAATDDDASAERSAGFSPSNCVPTVDARHQSGPVRLRGRAVIDGEPVDIVVYDLSSAQRPSLRIVAYDRDCADVFVRTITTAP